MNANSKNMFYGRKRILVRSFIFSLQVKQHVKMTQGYIFPDRKLLSLKISVEFKFHHAEFYIMAVKLEYIDEKSLRGTKFSIRGWRHRQSWFLAKCFSFREHFNDGERRKLSETFLHVFFVLDLKCVITNVTTVYFKYPLVKMDIILL